MNLRIAILEDQLVLRDSLAHVLEASGFSVATAADEAAFLSLLRSEDFQLAIVDLVIGEGSPEKTLDTLSDLRQWHPQTKVVVLSGQLSEELASRCRMERVAACIDKNGIDCTSLVNTLRSVAAGEGSFPAWMPFVAEPTESSMGPPSAITSLTPREQEVLRYVAAGADNLKIAALLNITERTVRAHVSALYRKLGPENRTQLALIARKLGIRPSAAV